VICIDVLLNAGEGRGCDLLKNYSEDEKHRWKMHNASWKPRELLKGIVV